MFYCCLLFDKAHSSTVFINISLLIINAHLVRNYGQSLRQQWQLESFPIKKIPTVRLN